MFPNDNDQTEPNISPDIGYIYTHQLKKRIAVKNSIPFIRN